MRAAFAIVRAWTFIYTWGLPRAQQERRRSEIESDLWESASHDDSGAAPALQIIGRFLLGLFDDLRWRVEQSEAARSERQAVAVTLAAIVLLVVMWISVAASRVEAPQPPDAPELGWRHKNRPAPPPPPPPPPPCNPPGIGRPAFSPCTPYPVSIRGGHK
jgi:hypothetical protein